MAKLTQAETEKIWTNKVQYRSKISTTSKRPISKLVTAALIMAGLFVVTSFVVAGPDALFSGGLGFVWFVAAPLVIIVYGFVSLVQDQKEQLPKLHRLRNGILFTLAVLLVGGTLLLAVIVMIAFATGNVRFG